MFTLKALTGALIGIGGIVVGAGIVGRVAEKLPLVGLGLFLLVVFLDVALIYSFAVVAR